MHLLKLYFLVVTFNKCNFFAQKFVKSSATLNCKNKLNKHSIVHL